MLNIFNILCLEKKETSIRGLISYNIYDRQTCVSEGTKKILNNLLAVQVLEQG